MPRHAFGLFVGRRKCFVVLCAVSSLFLVGCSDVQLSPSYSTLLDTTATLSDQTASRAEQGGLTPAQMTLALRSQATTWQRFQDARDGKVSK